MANVPLIQSNYPVFPDRPYFFAKGVAEGNAGTGSTRTIIFPETLYNNGNCYSTSTGRFTAPVAGWYHFDCLIMEETYYGNWNDWDCYFRKNGTAFAGILGDINAFQADEQVFSASASIYLAAAEWVDVVLFTSGANTIEQPSYFSGYLVG